MSHMVVLLAEHPATRSTQRRGCRPNVWLAEPFPLARACPRFNGGRYADEELEAAREGATIAETYRLPGSCRTR
jgi:hypothetical protein